MPPPRHNVTGFDPRKFAQSSGMPAKDPWARAEQWRYTGPFTRYNRFKGALPGLGTATTSIMGMGKDMGTDMGKDMEAKSIIERAERIDESGTSAATNYGKREHCGVIGDCGGFDTSWIPNCLLHGVDEDAMGYDSFAPFILSSQAQRREGKPTWIFMTPSILGSKSSSARLSNISTIKPLRTTHDMDDDEVFIEEDEALKQFFPTGFGKQTKGTDVARQLEKSKRPTTAIKELPSEERGGKNDSSDEDSEEDSDEDDDFPVSHELVLKTHERPITTITVDPSGSRFITGSTDCTIKFHDFASMTPNTLHAFKTIDPTATKASASSETHPVHHVEFNPSSPSSLLVISATPQAKIFSRDGEELKEFVKGDMYLRDMHNTKGHISAITTGTWHPTNKDLMVTAGTDSTLRIWDVNMPLKQKDVIVHKSRAAGSAGRTRMTAVKWGTPIQGGKNLLVAAGLDGSLVMWDGDGPYSRPSAEIREAHKRDTWTGGLDVSADGRTVVTRGGDDLIKLWDTRKFKQPISVVDHISTSDQYANTDIRFSPTSSSIITGSTRGELHILNPATLKPETVTPVTDGSPLVTLLWHEKLNQILTGSANAEMHVLYDPKTSTRGAVMVMSKAPKRRHIDDDPNFTTDLSQGLSGDAISSGDGLRAAQAGTSYASRHPTIGLTVSGRSRDPRRPHIPMTTPFAKSQPDEQHIKNNIPLSSMRDEDPREALLKYAEKAEKDPMFTNAWKQTQPKTLYADISDNEEEEGPQKKKARPG